MNRNEATARCWAEIDLDKLCANYRAASRIANPAEIICVLKGNAYGFGAKTVCKVLMEEGARRFAVASGDEAEELLAACPGADVLVLGAVGSDLARRLITQNIAFTLYDFEQGRLLASLARDLGVTARVHVKLDTGLHRLGFDLNEAAEQIAALHAAGGLRMEGLYTHLALHDRASDDEHMERFFALRRELAGRGISFELSHAMDSIGMTRYPEYFLDAVRVGAWLYGNCPRCYPHPEECPPTIRLKARVAQVRNVSAGERIGYDDVHFLRRASRVATLTVGYADGYPRLNNVGHVSLHGQAAPVLGLVCMDQMMVDVTDIPDVRPGDAATLLGDDISLAEYAQWGGLNRNEVLSRLSRRVVRIYRRGTEWFNDLQGGLS